MAKEEWRIGAFLFESKKEYERALKEKEIISQILANTDSSNPKELLKIYNKATSKKSFQTIVGVEFLVGLRKQIVESGLVAEDALAPVGISHDMKSTGETFAKTDSGNREKKFENLYNSLLTRTKIYRMGITFLLLIILAMLVITYKSKYSVLTFFTNYEEKIREEVENEYLEWEEDLQKREKALTGQEE